MKRLIIIYIIEIAIAAVILWYDQRLFFLYFFAATMMHLDRRAHHLEKMVRVFSYFSETKILALIHHLKISEEEIDNIRSKYLKRLTPEQERSLMKDICDLYP